MHLLLISGTLTVVDVVIEISKYYRRAIGCELTDIVVRGISYWKRRP
jgi:hypothetical protein